MPRFLLPFSVLGVFLLVLGLTPRNTYAQDGLIADMSDHLIAITTGFTGADVLLFGAVDEDSSIVVTIRGPEQNILVRRKSRVAGVWINDKEIDESYKRIKEKKDNEK